MLALLQVGVTSGADFTLGRRPIAPRRATPVRTRASGETVYDVTKYGAKGDNATDNTVAFHAALEACGAGCSTPTGDCGGQVYVPPGLFRFKGNMTVPSGCDLQGSYSMVPSHDLRHKSERVDDGSVLIPTAGRGVPCDIDCTASFIRLAADAAVRGLVIWHDEQERVALPVPYPWAIFMSDVNTEVSDVELLGAWNGVAAVQAHRHIIARVEGQPINIGVFVDETYDIGRIEDVHFNPWYSSSHPLVWWQATFGRAFVFGRSDWEYVLNTFAFGYGIGYHFIERATGSMNGNFVGIGADLITNASVAVDQSQLYGILITNGEFTAFCDVPQHTFCPPQSFRVAHGLTEMVDPSHLVVGHANVGTVSFSNSAFWGPAAQIAKVDGTGTTSFSQCHFDAWDTHIDPNNSSRTINTGAAAIQQRGGKLIVSASEFREKTGRRGGIVAPHLEIFKGAEKTIVTSNIVADLTGVVIVNESTGVVIVANNA